MKISDIFLPKIARSNPKVRKKAVMEEKNVQLLKKVVENDSNPEVRKAAQDRLKVLKS
ncbi:MAG: hypothetical protein ACOWWM_19860 [Desulfobacterales bacterium]